MSSVAMLAETSTRTVKTGFPLGGGRRSCHVGFRSTTSGNATAKDMSAIVANHRGPDRPQGRRHAYQPIRSNPASAKADHKAGWIRGSQVNVVMARRPRSLCAKESEPEDFSQQAKNASDGQRGPQFVIRFRGAEGGAEF